MNNRDYFRKIAAETVEIANKGQYQIGNRIYSFNNNDEAKVYKPLFKFEDIKNKLKKFEHTDIEIKRESTVDAIHRLGKKEKRKMNLGILNFASAHSPGGGFLNGAMAQEEALAYCSDLYKKQTEGAGAELYLINKLTKSIYYTDTMTIAPVTFFRDSRYNLITDNLKCMVLSCPAVNMKKVKQNKGSFTIAQKEMKNRMRKVLYLFAYSGCSEIVLGAFGCGVFENKAEDIARYWYELLFEENMKEYFEKITFSILDKEGKTSNYENFEKYFK